MLDELKQRELGNREKVEKMEVKKKTIDLLPDADNNLLKLQVGELSVMFVLKSCRALTLRGNLFVASGCGGGQCQAAGEPGCSVGETPCSTHSPTPHTQRDLQQPIRKCCLPHICLLIPSRETKACVLFPQLESSIKLAQIKSLNDKIRVSAEEARRKEEIYKQLVFNINFTVLFKASKP